MGRRQFTLRAARPDDATRLAAAERAIAAVPGRLASTPDEISDMDVRGRIVGLEASDRGVFLVAERAGDLVGHAYLEPLALHATSHVARLMIAVHEGYQRQGVGSALMAALVEWARANPRVEKIELQVRSSNHAAQALYRSFGFVEEGRKTRRLKIGEGVYLDDVYMALWVGP